MKHLLALFLAALLLTGCAQAAPASTRPSGEASHAATAPAGLWDSADPLEEKTQGAVRVYPLDVELPKAVFAMGESLLLLSGGEKSTLTRLEGSALYIAGEIALEQSLSPGQLQVSANCVSFLDEGRNQVVVLDGALKEIRHIALPQGAITPLLSPDQDTLYYATETAIKAWDLTRDIHRTVKELTMGQVLTGLYGNGTVMQCQVEDGVQLLSTQDGSLLWQGEALTLGSSGQRFYSSTLEGYRQTLVFGEADSLQCLNPADLWANATFLPRLHGCLTESALGDGEIRLDYYNLTTGRRQSCLPLTDTSLVWADGTSEGWVYLLVERDSGPAILRWDPTAPTVNDGNRYTGPLYTRENPDYHSLLSCQETARALGERYGIEILLWDETEGLAPWDYSFRTEYQIPVLEEALWELDAWLSRFPREVLTKCAGNFSGLTICLVRSITGTPESGSLDCADGIEYLDGTQARIALAVGPTAEKALYHELYHVMETQILNKSTALDQWDKLNPGDFAYTFDYAANETRPVGSWLDADIRSFVDQYAMSYPKEDRARIFEYAMTGGNEALFASSPLQYKLRQLCLGIREAFGLKKDPQDFPWEQYLWQSLAQGK